MSAPEQSYWQIAKRQFRKHRTAVFGLRVVVILFLLAIVSPVIATSSPFAMKVGDGPWRFPWFADLFDQSIWESGVDIFFNLLLVFLLPVAAAWFLLRRRRALVWKVAGGAFFWCFISASGPKGLVESSVGQVLFFPQHVFRYSNPRSETDYLKDERRPVLQRLAAEQRLSVLQPQVEALRKELAALEAELAKPDLSDDKVHGLKLEKTAVESDLEAKQVGMARYEESRKDALRAAEGETRTLWIAPIGFHHKDQDERAMAPPEWSGWGNSHILGTDNLGRDVLSRLLYGTRISLTIGVIAVSIYCTIGTILGSLMGFYGGRVDMLLMRLVEIMMCFPGLFFLLIIVGLFGKSIFVIMVAIGLIGWSSVARLIRGQFFSERNVEYVAAARALGIPTQRVVFRHVLPNAIHPLFVAATFGVASAILLESSLAFLGLGDPGVPSWGQLLNKGRETMSNWLILSPGVAIFITVTALNLVGEGLRDALDPKLRQ